MSKHALRLWSGQGSLLADRQKREHAVVSGVGYGKTHFGVRWHHARCIWNRESQLSVIGAPKTELLVTTIMPMYCEYLNELGYQEGKDYRAHWSTLNLKIQYSFGHSVIFRAMGPQSARSVVSYNASHAWVDEAGLCAENTSTEVTKRVRCPKARVRQKLFTGTPEGAKGFFFRKFGPQSVHRLPGTVFSGNKHVAVLHGRTYDNEYLEPDTVAEMRREMEWHPNLIKAYIEGIFVPVYDFSGFDYDAEKHAIDYGPPKPEYPIYLLWDFNVTTGRVGGVSWVAVQERGGDLIACAENRGSSRTTYEALDRFIADFDVDTYAATEIIINGDASGHARNPLTYDTHYQVIEAKLREAGFRRVQTITPQANPSVEFRIACCNRLFSDTYPNSLLIDKSCTKLENSLLMTTIDETGRVKKPKGESHTHFAEALGYGVTDLRPIEIPHHGAGVNIAF